MLNTHPQRGFTLIEAMVVLIIMGLLLAVAAPNFSSWIAGTRIRSTAESLLSGLQYAKSEATTRNAQVRFQLTTSLTASCQRSTSGTNWVVDMVDATGDSVVGQCNATPSDTVAPSILQVRASSETGTGVVVSASSSEVVFNGLARQVPISPATTTAAITIDISPSTTAGQCAASGGKVTCLRIVISPAGLVRMCSPTAPSDDPQRC